VIAAGLVIASPASKRLEHQLMNEQDRNNLFAELITRHQSELYGYIYAVVRNWEDTDDLYQSVCLVLWRKFDSFRPGSNFFAWARQTAKNKVGDFVRHKRLSYVTEELMDILTDSAVKFCDDGAEPYLAALRRCKEKLSAADDELLQLRYIEELSTIEIADRLQRLQQSISRSLNRIRRWLFECIQMELAKQEHCSKNLS
jgi:RNA polymerase sigma-70 factor, ECF subfamily